MQRMQWEQEGFTYITCVATAIACLQMPLGADEPSKLAAAMF